MKDEEFQKKLELILERFEKIDREITRFLEKEKFKSRNKGYGEKSNSYNGQILDGEYATKKVVLDNKYQ
jgi:hypothetical protein